MSSRDKTDVPEEIAEMEKDIELRKEGIQRYAAVIQLAVIVWSVTYVKVLAFALRRTPTIECCLRRSTTMLTQTLLRNSCPWIPWALS